MKIKNTDSRIDPFGFDIQNVKGFDAVTSTGQERRTEEAGELAQEYGKPDSRPLGGPLNSPASYHLPDHPKE